MGNFTVYWERIITDEDKVLLKKTYWEKEVYDFSLSSQIILMAMK